MLCHWAKRDLSRGCTKAGCWLITGKCLTGYARWKTIVASVHRKLSVGVLTYCLPIHAFSFDPLPSVNMSAFHRHCIYRSHIDGFMRPFLRLLGPLCRNPGVVSSR